MFTQEIADAICERIGEGEPLRVICRDAGMPAWRTVYHWIEENSEFAAHIAGARTRGFNAIAEDCLHIADTPLEGIETVTKPSGDVEERRGDMLGHRKLQIETRLKLLAKWDPKRYGDKMDLNHSGRILGSREMTEAELVSIAAGSSV